MPERQRNLDVEDRNEDLDKYDEVHDHLIDVYDAVENGFQDQWERSNDMREFWEIYNCVLNEHQYYTGNSKIYIPIVADAIRARKTRFSNQIFPRTGKYIDAVTESGETPYAQVALCENYIRLAKLRELIPALIKNGDIEGHYHVCVSWCHTKRHVTERVQHALEVQLPGGGQEEDPDEEVEDLEEVDVKAAHPRVEILADSDVCVLPATADSLDEALEAGGSVTVLRRWTKAAIKELIERGDIDKKVGKDILNEMAKDQRTEIPDKQKYMAEAAGIKKDGRGKYIQAYETWTKIKAKDWKEPRLVRAYFVRPKTIGSCKRNPWWCDRLPILSVPVDKVQGVFKGRSLMYDVKEMQYYANDMVNEAADSSAFSMLPIIMTNPEKNPRIGSMVLTMGAVWETSPNDTQFAKFPELWKDGLEAVTMAKGQIFQTYSVNPAQITQQAPSRGGKRNQSEIANEQQVDILTTADAVTVLEEGILNPMAQLFMELDVQYRTQAALVARYGFLGREASLQRIPPQKVGRALIWQWLGVEVARQTQLMQQKISALNILRTIPPQMYQGYQANLGPAIAEMLEAIFSPRITPRIFSDMRYQMSQDPEAENILMLAGHDAIVHPMDNHQQHMQVHQKALPMDPTNYIVRKHLLMHQQAMMLAMQAAAQQTMMPGQGGPAGGQGPGRGPGQRGGRPGAAMGQPRLAQQQPGAIHQDRLPLAMPRRGP